MKQLIREFLTLLFLLFISNKFLRAQITHEDSLHFIKDNKKHYYNLVKPDVYQQNSKAIVFIDPGGIAEIPLKKYQNILSEFRCLGICSWEIKNGPLEEDFALISSLIDHLNKEYSIKRENIILSGFSGGSRIASGYAAKTNGIIKVIACGSGFAPGMKSSSLLIPDYVGIVGLQDMNLTEMITDYKLSLEITTEHYLMMFMGTHEWPDSYTYRKAYIILNSTNPEVLETVLNDEKEKILRLLGKNMIMEAYFSCLSLYSFFDQEEMQPTPVCINNIDANKANSLLKNEKEEIYKFTNALDLIRSESQGLNIEKKTRLWWETEIEKIMYKLEYSKNPRIINENKRLLSFISFNAFEYAMILIKFEKKYEYATEFLEIWSLTSPGSPLPYYTLARNYMRLKKSRLAKKNLDAAMERGLLEFVNPEVDTIISPLIYRNK